MFEQVHFHIVIVSEDLSLQNRMEGLSCPEGITTTLVTVDAEAEMEREKADIILWDRPLQRIPTLKQNQLLVGIASEEECEATRFLSGMQEDDIAFLWRKPLSQQLLTFYYRQLIAAAKEKKYQEYTRVFLETLINSVPDLVWFKDLRGSHLKVNDAFGKAVGKTREQCEGRGHYYIWDIEPDEYADGEYVCLETEEEVIRRGETCLFDEKVKGKNGLRQFKTYKSPLYDEEGIMFGTVGVAKDVTDMQNLSQELEVILSSLPLVSVVADDKDTIIYANHMMGEYFGMSEEEVLKMPYSVMCKEIMGHTAEELDREESFDIASWNGDVMKYLRIQQQSIHDIFNNHFGYFLIGLDMTSEHEMRQEIWNHANTDFLTSLYNRRYLYDVVYQKPEDTDAVFIYMDLDNFKVINDVYGHQMGDEALIAVAKLLKEHFAEDLVVRLGGDEFIVCIFRKVDYDAMEQSVSDFIIKIREFFSEHSYFKPMSVSAGVSYCAGTGFRGDVLIFQADTALYKAKALGKNQYFIYSEQ